MSLITINLPETIKVRLKQEPNQSALITRLLEEYFMMESESLQEKREKLEKLKEEKKYQIEVVEKEIEKVDKQVEKQEEKRITDTEKAAQANARREELIKNVIKNAMDYFNVILTREQAEIYLNSDFPTLLDFINSLQK